MQVRSSKRKLRDSFDREVEVRGAVSYGPVHLALQLGRRDLQTQSTYVKRRESQLMQLGCTEERYP
jgi:hypothetical protein